MNPPVPTWGMGQERQLRAGALATLGLGVPAPWGPERPAPGGHRWDTGMPLGGRAAAPGCVVELRGAERSCSCGAAVPSDELCPSFLACVGTAPGWPEGR